MALRPGRPRPGAGAIRPPAEGEDEGPPPFDVVTSGERIEGLAPGIDRAHLRRLRSGEIAIERRVDLHGLSARAARTEVRRALLDAFEAAERCVLVVHGRGMHSPEGPVLKAFLLKWLTEPTLARSVMAFASARPRDGGAGATYVLLRRRR